jgi:hypothetical protein
MTLRAGAALSAPAFLFLPIFSNKDTEYESVHVRISRGFVDPKPAAG